MRECERYQQQMIEYLEDQLAGDAYRELLEHIVQCAVCAQEFNRLKQLYRVMDEDEVTLPSVEFFERVKLTSRQRVTQRRRVTFDRLARILVPALAVAAILLVVFGRLDDTVEINIPVTNLIEDQEIADIVFAGIVNEEVFNEIIGMEDYLAFDNDDEIEDMTIEERKELVDALYQRYALDT